MKMEKSFLSFSKMKYMLLFLIIVGFTSSFCLELVEKTPPNGPGIYFDPAGKVKFLADHMEIVTYVNVNSTQQSLEGLLYSMHRAVIICYQTKVLDNTTTCENTLNSLGKSLNDNLQQIQNVEEIKSSRQKRSFLGIIAGISAGIKVIKGFFGLFFSSKPAIDYGKYNRAFEKLIAEQKSFVTTMDGKIAAVVADIEKVQTNLIAIEKNEKELKSDLQGVVNFLNAEKQLSDENRKLLEKNSENIENLQLKVMESQKIIEDYEKILKHHAAFLKSNEDKIQVTNIKYKVNTLLFNLQIEMNEAFGRLKNIIQGYSSSKMGVLHPNIMTAEQVHEVLDKNMISGSYELPAVPVLENIKIILELSEISSYCYENKLVFIIKVPLVHKMQYNVFSVVPLPVPVGDNNDMFIFIKPHNSKQYLALSADRMTYSRLDSLEDCKQISKHTSMCEIENILPTSEVPTCETKLLVNVLKELPEECSVRYIHGSIDYWNRLNNNRWIFVQSDRTRLSLDCNKRVELEEMIIGSGILNIPLNCSTYAGLNRLVGDVRDMIDIQTPKIFFELSQDKCCRREELDDFKEDLKPSALSSNNLEHFVSMSYQLPQDFTKETSSFKIAAYVILGVTLVVVCAFFLYKYASNFVPRLNNRYIA